MEEELKRSKRFGAKGELLVVIQIALVALFVLIPVWPDFSDCDLYRQLTLLRWSSLVTGMLAGAMLVIGGVTGIRRYLTPLPYPVENNRLVDTGVYALVRHPLYSAQLLATASWTIYTLSLSHLIVTIASYIFFSHKASKEEAWLTERHPEYRDYASRVGKFVPGVERLKE
jgi:protein-S-isoprenylcysteine O-methyltransferase Ste14